MISLSVVAVAGATTPAAAKNAATGGTGSKTNLYAELWARWPEGAPYSHVQANLERSGPMEIPPGLSCQQARKRYHHEMLAWLEEHGLSGQFTVILECRERP